ncbi:ribonuclease H-like domain-containing protein [Candidatus Woesearchaeota archaeon]|nr:ribonuclease H-like domain-containing protein [Candidatus Woesearchaeota archaeon]
MITHSFILLDGIGYRKEQQLWKEGILHWDDFLQAKQIQGISPLRKQFLDHGLAKAQESLRAEEISFFAQHLPKRDYWRLYEKFRGEALFLDIETSGYYGDVTVIGLYDGKETKTMVKGCNLNKELLVRTLQQYKLLITFNGSSFDLPVLDRYFGKVIPTIPHIDLRHVCSRVGLVGGLKAIEQQVAISRPPELMSVHGIDAVALWQQWQSTGEERYLDLLIRYNEEDVLNLKPLAERVIRELWNQTCTLAKRNVYI